MSFTTVDCTGLALTNLAAATVSRVSPVVPKLPRITPSDAVDPVKMGQLIERIQQDVAALLAENRTHPLRNSIEFVNIGVTPGADFTLRHNFGRRVRYVLTGASGGVTVTTVANENSALTLTPNSTATISVLVF